MESLQEISKYLSPNTRFDVKICALNHVLRVTATTDGRELLLKLPEILIQLVTFVQDSCAAISKCAAQILVNITGDESGTNAMLIISESSNSTEINKSDLVTQEFSQNLIKVCLRAVTDKSSVIADLCCMILSNMTRPFHLIDRMITLIEQSGYSWDEILSVFTAKQYNTKGNKLHYLGPIFSNLSRSPRIRRYFMDRNRCVIQLILPFTEYSDSLIRRGGIVGTLKNCTFDTENHVWLLSPEIDLLSYLLLPLAGPEEFDDEDMSKLPINLQYLPETKTRETDPDIRLMLLEALNQLCATKVAREMLREANTYLILRELHKWEKDKNCLLACENVVDILIKTEKEIGLDNLKEVEVPSAYTEMFHKMDKEFISNT
ncbi:PREDICTED: protein HGH1 homolog isoform X1 [Trachymyrmex septentrionalis]|uniref:protein HGH1 homolog isoform X1 n=1 Tax=Trachymyrmex septentrionalis TaxID=34720 RepID=UPI00084EF3CD|nr:PREDICTED: protein HGH1 homolog isoform X1 [Trachymyrmex septentrionalis]